MSWWAYFGNYQSRNPDFLPQIRESLYVPYWYYSSVHQVNPEEHSVTPEHSVTSEHSVTPVPAVRRKRQDKMAAAHSTGNLPQAVGLTTSLSPSATTPPTRPPISSKHLSLLNVSGSSLTFPGDQDGDQSSLSVSLSPQGSMSSTPSPSSHPMEKPPLPPTSPPERPPLPQGYGSLGRSRPMSAHISPGTQGSNIMPSTEQKYMSLDRATSKPKRPAPLPTLTPLQSTPQGTPLAHVTPVRRNAPQPPKPEPIEINNNTIIPPEYGEGVESGWNIAKNLVSPLEPGESQLSPGNIGESLLSESDIKERVGLLLSMDPKWVAIYTV